MSAPSPRLPAVSRRTKGAAVGGSLGYVLVLLAAWYWVYGDLSGLGAWLFTVQVGPWLVYAFAGGAIVGAVLGVAAARYGLVSPAVVVAALFGVAMYSMWQALQGPYVLLPGHPFDIYLVGWPVTLGLAVAAGVVERAVRGVVGRRLRANDA